MPDLMVEQPLRDSIDNLQEAVRRQVEAYFTLGKLQLIEYLAKVGTLLFTSLVLVILAAFFLLFVGFAFAFWYGARYGSVGQGLLIVACAWVVLGVLAYLLRGVIFSNPVVRKLWTIFFKKK